MIGTIIGIVSGKDHNSWEDTVKYGIGVGVLYMIVAVMLAFIEMIGITFSYELSGIMSAFSGLLTGYAVILLIPIALVAGIIETSVGHIIWFIVETVKDAIKGL